MIKQNPKNRKHNADSPYWIPIVLWSVEKTYLRQNPSSGCASLMSCVPHSAYRYFNPSASCSLSNQRWKSSGDSMMRSAFIS